MNRRTTTPRAPRLGLLLLFVGCAVATLVSACGAGARSTTAAVASAGAVTSDESPTASSVASPAKAPSSATPTAPEPAAAAPAPASTHTAARTDPSKATLKAPNSFVVRFDTDAGAFRVRLTRSWAPQGVDRFYNLVVSGYFRDIAIFRAIRGFMLQFGVHGDPAVSAVWRDASIPDDPVQTHVASNRRGTLTFAMAGPNTRTTQLFINLGNNARLDRMGFPPIGQIVSGEGVLGSINTEYGEGAPAGRGPSQARVQMEGNVYLRRSFPRLTRIRSITLVPAE